MRPMIIIIIALGTVLLLGTQYPQAIDSFDDRMHILYLLMFLALLGTGWSVGRLQAGTALKYAAIWGCIILGLVLAYTALSHLAR